MTEKPIEERMLDAIKDGCRKVAELRNISYADALSLHIDQCRENERDSKGVPKEVAYWQKMKMIAENELARQMRIGRTPHPVLDEEAQARLV